MAWDEWEQAKAGAADRYAAGTRLNSHSGGPGDGGGGKAGRLASEKRAWNAAGEGVGSLRENIGRAVTRLEEQPAGPQERGGCLTSRSRDESRDSWVRYLRDVSGRCGALQKLLRQVGHDLFATDGAVRDAFEQHAKKYADTPAVGGRPAGR